jgi:hypothetical protein
VAKLLALLVGDSGAQVLNLDQSLADEYDLSDFGNSRSSTSSKPSPQLAKLKSEECFARRTAG